MQSSVAARLSHLFACSVGFFLCPHRVALLGFIHAASYKTSRAQGCDAALGERKAFRDPQPCAARGYVSISTMHP